MGKLDVLTHEINNSGQIMQNNSVIGDDIASLFPAHVNTTMYKEMNRWRHLRLWAGFGILRIKLS